ncbi:cell division protein FtsZ [candidate division KSB1 bacterium]|nr:cell division protein FtsZ [candidate division KSB1 bacterium]
MATEMLQGEKHPNEVVSTIKSYPTIVKVLGAGGAGNNTISSITSAKLKNLITIALNTDGQDLLAIRADERLLIGRELTNGLGAGGDPVIGERSAEESREAIEAAIKGTDLLFLTCGLGGGTGTGSLPIIARVARSLGTLTIAIVTMPFSEEGIIRWENAQVGLEKLKKFVDTVIVLRNDKLIEKYPDLPMRNAFQKGDEILFNSLVGLTDLIQDRGMINLDFADVSMILRDGPSGVIGLGQSDSENRAEEAAHRAVTHPMMDDKIAGAQSALVHVSGGLDMTLKEAREVVRIVAKAIDASARIIWGVTIDKSLKQSIKVMLIVTGIQERIIPKRNEEIKSEKQLETPQSNQANSGDEIETPVLENGQSIFDIKESIMASGNEMSIQHKSAKPVTQATKLFYTIFEEEATNDLSRFDRSLHALRKNPENRRALLDARQSCKLLQASAMMFGFDEISQLLGSIDEILACVQSHEIRLGSQILDSVTLAMEMVVDLLENRNDGKGETGYLVDRLKELRNEQLESYNSTK